MITHFARVISKLYRPPSSVRQVFALSRAEAERLPLVSTAAIISITAPDKGPAALPDFEHVLRFVFEDVDHLNDDLSARAKAKLSHSFTTEHAQQILKFVAELPDESRTIIVHCEGGFSRSAAVVSALHRLYGYTVEKERLTQSNPSVISVLLDAARQK